MQKRVELAAAIKPRSKWWDVAFAISMLCVVAGWVAPSLTYVGIELPHEQLVLGGGFSLFFPIAMLYMLTLRKERVRSPDTPPRA